jgi:hypothetical protein
MGVAVNDMTIEESFLKAVVRVPETTVYRAFVAETVVLNLETGMYHGLNPTGGRMLELLDQLGSVEATLNRLVEEFEETNRDELGQDLHAFCADLAGRKLIQIDAG